MNLTFLGTGGGRFTMIKQLRRTAGMYLEHDGYSLYIDPGPGALVHARQADIALEDLDGIIVSHAHLDHCGDMNVLIEAMTHGGDRSSGTLYAAQSVMEGAQVPERFIASPGKYGTRIDPELDAYHRSQPEQVITLEDGAEHEPGPFEMHCFNTEHSDPTGIAFTLATDERRIGFLTDTELEEGLTDFFSGCDVIIVNVARPHDAPWDGHLTTNDAAAILNEVEPEYAVLQHFGAKMIFSPIKDEAAWLRDQTDVDFVMAKDGMKIDLEKPKAGLERFL